MRTLIISIPSLAIAIGMAGALPALALDDDGGPVINHMTCGPEGGQWDGGGGGSISSCCFEDGCYICDGWGFNCEFDPPYGGPWVNEGFGFESTWGDDSSMSSQGGPSRFQSVLPMR